MARKIKKVISKCGIDRRDSGYYSTPLQVATYIANRLLEINPKGNLLIDPCVGKEELIQAFINKNISITGIDIFDYSNEKTCKYIKGDFIEFYQKYKSSDFDLQKIKFDDFDYWVANPPYNCHEVDFIRDNKLELKKTFNDVGVHNMYSMFVTAIIDMAKEGAIIGLITLDSFLTSKAHTHLRTKILNSCVIHDILLCPTDLFLDQGADVRTCILIIEKGKNKKQGPIKVINRQITKHSFFESLEKNDFDLCLIKDIALDSNLDNRELIIGVPHEINALFKNKRICQLFSCVTGISTGNDKKYISSKRTIGFTIPFYKNPGSRKFFCEPDGFLIDSFLEEAKNVKTFMVRNISLLNKPGITCSSVGVEFSACYRPHQSTFGVNPNIICDENDIWWLLAYLNSNIAKYMIRGVLIRANMVTSGYVARLPVPYFSEEEKYKLASISIDAYESAKKTPRKLSDDLDAINDVIYNNLALTNETIFFIENFCTNIVKMS
jgi:adenine-specific DNA-methyltransferase